MLESKAKTKWCPFSRWKFAGMDDSPSMNREGGSMAEGKSNPWVYAGTRCLGSDCALWEDYPPPKVWLNGLGEPLLSSPLVKVPHGYKAVATDNGKLVEWHRVSDELEGQCGLITKESGCFYPG